MKMPSFSIWSILNNVYELLQLCVGMIFFIVGFHAFLKNDFNYLTFFVFFTGLTMISWTLASETFGRTFDKYFSSKLEQDSEFRFRMAVTMRLPPQAVGKFRLVRTLIYSREIILRRNLNKNNNMDSRWFGNFDFRKKVNWLETLLAYSVAMASFLMIFSILWPAVSALLGYIKL